VFDDTRMTFKLSEFGCPTNESKIVRFN